MTTIELKIILQGLVVELDKHPPDVLVGGVASGSQVVHSSFYRLTTAADMSSVVNGFATERLLQIELKPRNIPEHILRALPEIPIEHASDLPKAYGFGERQFSDTAWRNFLHPEGALSLTERPWDNMEKEDGGV